MSKPIVIVIVAHGRPDLLRRTLGSLAECQRPARVSGVIVVENGKQCGVEAAVREADPSLHCRYLFEPSSSKTVALNRALAELNDELVVFFDDDVRLSPNVLMEYATASEGIDRGVYFGGPTGCDYEQEPPEWLKAFLPPSAIGYEPALADRARVKHPGFLGFNWAAFARDLTQCGGFNKNFGPGCPVSVGDESFMQHELNRSGIFGLWLSKARVWHFIGKDRCTVTWAVRRAYSGGFASGAFQARGCGDRVTDSVWQCGLRELRRRTRRGNLMELLQLTKSGRVWLRHTFVWMRGFVAGWRFAILHDPFRREGLDFGKLPQPMVG